MDNLFEQIANIAKANAYDILVKHVADMKETMMQLIEIGELEDLTFTDTVATKLFQFWVNRAKVLSIGAEKQKKPVDPSIYFMAANMGEEQIKETIGIDISKIDE